MTTAKSASYDYLIKLLLIGDSGKAYNKCLLKVLFIATVY
jgi:hypothetical protein